MKSILNWARKRKTIVKILIISSGLVALFSFTMLVSMNSTDVFGPNRIQGLQRLHVGEPQKPITAPSSRVQFSHRKEPKFCLKEIQSMSLFTSRTWNTTCLNIGTRFTTYNQCICRKGWYGRSCSIPDSLYHSYSMTFVEKRRLRIRRKTARRIIYAALFNHEFDMLEALTHEHSDLVDVFILVESAFTAFGARKPLRLLPRLHRGYLHQLHSKIMYLYLDHFPTGARKKGWKADSYLRRFLGKQGLANIHNVRHDDLFLVFDIDEIPSRDSVAFLKFHDGYPEPFGMRLRWSVFGFFWLNRRYTQVTVGCTVGMLTKVYSNDSNLIRAIDDGLDPNFVPQLRKYRKQHYVRSWFMGEEKHLAGWHCSSCFDAEGIRTKFISAQNADYPRWGSIPEKMDLDYIRSLIQGGLWFDGGAIPESDDNTDESYAPRFMLQNADKYRHLLVNPYRNTTTS